MWQPLTMGTARRLSVPCPVSWCLTKTARSSRAPACGRVSRSALRPGTASREARSSSRLQSPEAGGGTVRLAKAQAELTSRRAQATYAKSARARAERLLALKAIPRQDYERAVADDELAQSAVAQAKAELRRARSSPEQLGAIGSANGEIALPHTAGRRRARRALRCPGPSSRPARRSSSSRIQRRSG